MAIRKEQVLALATLGVAALVAPKYFRSPEAPPAIRLQQEEYKATPVRGYVLADANAPKAARRDPFVEPSETQPLPPRPIEFPPRAPLSVVALPLDPGPDPGHYSILAIDGALVAEVAINTTGEAPAAEAAPAPVEPAAAPTRADRERNAARTFDRVYAGGLSNPFWGTLLPLEGVELLALEKSGDFGTKVLRLRTRDLEKGRDGEVMTFGGEGVKIDKIVLAGTLRNDVARQVRDGTGTPQKRRETVLWLLEKAKIEGWIYDEALRQAQAYRATPGLLDGWRLELEVLRARGDVVGEVALLESLPANGLDAALRFEGLANVRTRLCLWQDAENDLRQAVKLAPVDARMHAALADFLRQRGRSAEAMVAVRAAEGTIGTLAPEDLPRVVRSIVACRLAVGDVAGAKAALQQLPSASPQPYLAGCIAYAAGDVAAAASAFQQVAGGVDAGPAQLGLAACLLRQQKWQEAYDLLVQVSDQQPLLRHRAQAGLALLWSRLGQVDTALGALDRALEADPQDVYATYLRGRCQRLLGNDGTEETLRAVLRQRDDFVHAIAEMSLTKGARSTEMAGDALADAALAARRYADRAVQLCEPPRRELFEVQGVQAFRAADVAAAEAAFQKARDAAGDDRERAFAKGALAVVEYSRGSVDDAAIALQRLEQDLPKENPVSVWAKTSNAAIFDHAQKEMLNDGFARADLGRIWIRHNDGELKPELVDGGVVLRGHVARSGRGERFGDPGMVEIWAERELAVAKGRNFLAVGVDMKLGAKASPTDGFSGLGIEVSRGSSGIDFQALLGVRNGKPWLRLLDGQKDDDKAGEPGTALEVPGFDRRALQKLSLRVEPRGEKQFTLLVEWNGAIVHRRDLKSLSGSTSNELKTFVFGSASKDSDLDVAFDDYHLERRKDA